MSSVTASVLVPVIFLGGLSLLLFVLARIEPRIQPPRSHDRSKVRR